MKPDKETINFTICIIIELAVAILVIYLEEKYSI